MNDSPNYPRPRILWGSLLILAGVLFLVQNLGLIQIGGLLWALLLLAAGVFFLSLFVRNRLQWWALIPGLTLAGVAGSAALDLLAPDLSNLWGGSIVLGAAGLSFLGVYLAERTNWWAIIPCGVLLTLAAAAGLEHFISETANLGVFFLGLGLTFAVVALLATPRGGMAWAWVPAGILALVGGIVMVSSGALLDYLWPVALIGLGAFLILRALLKRG